MGSAVSFPWLSGKAGSRAAVGLSTCAVEVLSSMALQAVEDRAAAMCYQRGWETSWAHPSLVSDLRLSRGRIVRAPPFASFHCDTRQSCWRVPHVSYELAALLALRNMVAVARVAPFLLQECLACAAVLVAASTPLRCMRVPTAFPGLPHSCRSIVGAHSHQRIRLQSLAVLESVVLGGAHLPDHLPD